MGMGTGGVGVGATSSETVYYVKVAADKGQYKVLPVVLTVLIDQDRVQDFLVELENSPMSIQVMDFELARPTARVEKPEKGLSMAGGSGEMGMMGMMMGGGQMQAQRMMMQMGGGSAYGGMASQMQNQMMQMMSSGYGMMGRTGGTMGGMGATAGQPKRTGKDVRSVDRSKQRSEKQKAVEQAKGPSLFDPYFDIVQVTIYGQARFFNPPPADATIEPSLGQAASLPATAETSGAPSNPAAKALPPQSPSGQAKSGDGATTPEDADHPSPDGAGEAGGTGKGTPKAAPGATPAADADAQSGKRAPKASDTPETKADDDIEKPSPKAGGQDKSHSDPPAAKP
jgi:hypothetical protein